MKARVKKGEGDSAIRRRRKLFRISVVGCLILVALTYGVAQLPGITYSDALNVLVASAILVVVLALTGLVAAALLYFLRSRLHWLRSRK